MRTTTRLRLLAGAALAGALLVMPAGPMAAQTDCSLTVLPKEGAPGTRFTFTGTGFTSTQLVLKRDGANAITVPVTDTGDPFTVKLIAADSEVGRWRAVADGCADPATFRVTLPPTSAAASAASTTEPDRTPALAVFLLLAVLFLASFAVLLPRVSRRPRQITTRAR